MFRNRENRPQLLWIGGTLVTVAVTLLAILQFSLLGRLRELSAVARLRRADALANRIAARVFEYFERRTEASLDFTRDELFDSEQAAARFARTDFAGAREFFLVRPDDTGAFQILFFDRSRKRLVARPDSGAIRAIQFAIYPWSTQERRRTLRQPWVGKPGPDVAQTRMNLDLVPADAGNRIALHPVGFLPDFAGATGYVIDDRFVVETLLPKIIRAAVADESAVRDPMRVSVRQARTGATLYGSPNPSERPIVRKSLRYGMYDVVVEIYNADDAAALASRSFSLNVALLLFVAINAVVGTLLTVQVARAQARVASMKSEFISNVTHELRTPLASIRLFGRLIRTGSVDTIQETTVYGAHVEEESERLARMVERVLKLSRFEGRLNPVAEEKVDLVSVVRSALRNHEPLAEASGVHVECRVPDHPIVIAGNEESLVAALSNLIENAIHYSICQPKQIEIALTSNEASSEISVRDHGIGIPAREHQRIFERFYRVNDDAVRAVSGSGLGLAIVKAAVEAHCGTISISSRPGAGSTFIIRLPAAMNVDAAESPASLRAS